jgi:hypothetical protein
MKPVAFYSVLAIGVLVVIGVIAWGVHIHGSDYLLTSSRQGSITSVASSTLSAGSPSLAGLSIYTNGQYGFSLFYPSTMKAQATFDSQYHLPATWRVNALPNATGTPIVAIVGYTTTSSNSFPRYFETEVRVGASADPSELATCEKPGNGESSLPDKVINGVSWKAFSLQDAGMMQYLQGISYRTIHDDTCFALEQVETGSSYADDPPSTKDIPQATLDQHYTALVPIIQSFTFARP